MQISSVRGRQPGTWLKIDRSWKNGERIEFALDMPLRLQPIDTKHPDVVALLHGPVALFAIAPEASPTAQQYSAPERLVLLSSDWEVFTAQGRILLKPYAAITTEHYPYNMKLKAAAN